MKILFLSTWFPHPPDNGSKIRVYHLLRALAQEHEVTLVSFAFDTAQPDEPGQLCSWCQDIQIVPLDPFAANQAGTVHTFLSARPMASRPIPAMSKLVADVLRAASFDVIIASTTMMADYALQAPASTVKILEEHNSLTRWMRERYAEQTGPLQRLRCWVSWQKTRRYEAALFRRFDMVTMVSEQDHVTCMAELPGYNGPVAIIANGVDCTHNHPDLAQFQPDSLVFNGSLTYSANFDAMQWFLANVYPHVRTEHPCVSLTITGSTHDVDLAGLALDDTVHLTGFVDDVRMPVAAAAVCVAPIRQGGGTRLKILEAMALGTPVVATGKGAEGLAVCDGEHLLIADEPEAFAAGVCRLLDGVALRRYLAANARCLVEEKYDWNEIGAQFVRLVEETVERKRAVIP